MNLDDFSNLDPQNFGNWPILVKGVIIAVLCAAALFAGYWFDTQHQMGELLKVQAEEGTLKTTFETKQEKAATLPKLIKQLAQIRNILKTLYKKLPNENKLPDLINDIGRAVSTSGVTSPDWDTLYKKKEMEDIYFMIPIKLQVRGNYHAFGKLISDLSELNRIVTLHNITIKSNKVSNNGDTNEPLTMNMTAQIYRYRDKTEKDDKKNKKKKGKK
ncbi:MAG: type 4a pilus biogenesis protein PilO [Thiomargarita sp.]|nr:type 4a pilus biogenesis protein PilO [Thiomargarita sp.]